ncbi:MAG: PLP-dependent cysteine synthase family protein [Brevinematia bacterium]
MKFFSSITEMICNTPMLRLKTFSGNNSDIFAKLEWYNAGGSVKDRLALFLIEYAESAGILTKDKVILEATSGNTGIGLAMIAAVKGYRIDIVMPESVSIERRKIIKAYGANLILSPGEKGTGGAIEVKKELLKLYPDRYIDLDQFSDPANILAHYHTTGKEILEQLEGKIDMVIVGIGTAGTGVGVSMRLKQFNSNIKIVGVMPKLGTRIQGMRHINEPNPTKLFRGEWFDEIVEISNEELPATYQIARELARKEGILVGISSASIMYVAISKSKSLPKNTNIVSVLPDNAYKYLSTNLFED